MYKVFLVEDEMYVLESLKAIIDWEALGFKVIGDANNGLEAYRKIKLTHPDIIFTDIMMPKMSGLELIQRLKEEGDKTLFVIVSGYAEFAYAQKVFNFGGIGYCLKPFDVKEITSVLKKGKDILDNYYKNLEFRILELINEKDSSSEQEIIEALKYCGFEYNLEKSYVIAVSIGTEPLYGKEEHKPFILKIGTCKYLYILDAGYGLTYLDDALANSQFVNGVGISQKIDDFKMFKDAVKDATVSAYTFFSTGKAGIFKSEESITKVTTVIFQSLNKALESKELPLIKKSISMAESYFSQGICSVKNIFRFYNEIISFISKMGNFSLDDYLYSYEELFKQFGNLKEMMAFLNNMLDTDFGMKLFISKDDYKSQIFAKILNYINDNYQSDINLHSVADEFNTNPSYLSQLFKRELDMTYTDYITNLRIKFAENLLNNTSLQVAEISEKTGYNDYFYFVKVFKKAKGMTPTEYKRSNLQDNSK